MNPAGPGRVARLGRRVGRVIGGALLLAGTVYCGGETPSAPVSDPALYWSLTASDHAVVLAVGETLHISATPRDASGTVMTDLPKVTFTTLDPGTVAVDSNGVLQGLGVTNGVVVVASLQARGVTHVDTINVAVTATATSVTAFSIHPTPPDSAVIAVNQFLFITPTVLDAGGQPLFGLPVKITWSDSTKIQPFFGLLQTQAPGTVKVIASMNAYGVALTDTVTYRVTYATSAMVQIDSATSAFLPAGPKIQANGSVTWMNNSLIPASVTFDNPANVQGGNIPVIAPGESATRTFLAAGTYGYHGGTAALTGRVIVY
jgi:plastocyanin